MQQSPVRRSKARLLAVVATTAVAALALASTASARELNLNNGQLIYLASNANSAKVTVRATNNAFQFISTDGKATQGGTAFAAGVCRQVTVQFEGGSKPAAACNKGGITSISFKGSNQSDTFNNKSGLPSGMDGAAGNDTLSGGGATDIIIGSLGSDTMHGGSGDDLIDSRAGATEVPGSRDNEHDNVYCGGGFGDQFMPDALDGPFTGCEQRI